MTIPKKIQALVERFKEQKESYKSGKYNETLLRQDFLNPMLKELGWDVDNEQGHAEAYREVIHEDAVKVGSATKAPDYSCRIGGIRKFFVEAKKPSIHIKGDPAPAYQLRRYAWSANLPISILTDFEEFAVYDCRQKPKLSDGPAVGRIFYCTYDQYKEHWDHIQSIFSKEAILKGSFDKYAEEATKKRGTAEVDDEFLKEIESWRDQLAKSIALRNPKLMEQELNYAVQKTIDRLIFLRICEDRGIEEYSRLLAEVNGTNIYGRLKKHFKDADAKYNSGLFHFQEERGISEPADTWTLGLAIDDNVLNEIISHLYYPESPYEFSVLPADLLGHVYEQFLGKVIRLTEGHRAKIEEKPEVRKAGGVYYTPTHIVQYIVEQTVGKMLEGKTPKQAEKLRIVDPACGSGSFLLGAYQKLLDWHLLYYTEHDPTKQKNALYKGVTGDWKLTTSERKRILLNNIYGVDLDAQAVEVTKLSLLLKVLEGENQETLGRQLSMFKERALPSLSNNIKCGNSLIGTDFYSAVQSSLLEEEGTKKVNAFDWETEFADVFKQGGFDVVIGNPPWGASFSSAEEQYLVSKYLSGCKKSLDSYALFIEAATQKLSDSGLLSFITPDTFLRKNGYKAVREMFFRYTVKQLIETGPLFSKVRDTWCLVFVISKHKPSKNSKIEHKKISRFVVSAEDRLKRFANSEWDYESSIEQDIWMKKSDLVVGYYADKKLQELINKIESHRKLSDLFDSYLISRGEEGSKFSLNRDKDGDYIMLTPENVNRYWISNGVTVQSNSLAPNKQNTYYSHPKIWLIRIQKMRWKQRIVCSYDDSKNSAGMKTLQIIISTDDDRESLLYLQGILSSKLINFWCINYLADDLNQTYLEQIPVPMIKSADKNQKEYHDKLVALVEHMLVLYKKMSTVKTPHEQEQIKRQIAATDIEIDNAVFELYGLSEEERNLVVSSTFNVD